MVPPMGYVISPRAMPRLDARVQLARRIERRLAGAILDQLDRPEESAASDVADVW